MPRKSAGTAAKPAPSNETTEGIQTEADLEVQAQPEPTSPPAKKAKKSAPTDQMADMVALEDLLLPRSLISRLARGVLPANTSIQKDAILALSKSAAVFISHLASEANDLTEKKTVQPTDVFNAIHQIEFAGVMMGTFGAEPVHTNGKLGSARTSVGKGGRASDVNGHANGELGVSGKGRVEAETKMWETIARDKRNGYRDKVKARNSGVNVENNDHSNIGDPLEMGVDIMERTGIEAAAWKSLGEDHSSTELDRAQERSFDRPSNGWGDPSMDEEARNGDLKKMARRDDSVEVASSTGGVASGTARLKINMSKRPNAEAEGDTEVIDDDGEDGEDEDDDDDDEDDDAEEEEDETEEKEADPDMLENELPSKSQTRAINGDSGRSILAPEPDMNSDGENHSD